ncbi:MAG: hypothetical protein QY310_15780 [Candidatus Jettenia sp. CY-1]|nr:MAG: hypothetical protein QY310_15780 [Candidatus Jettenia sp. CY-1]
MKYFLIVITLIILSGTYYTEAIADISYADMFLSGKGYKPVEDTYSAKSSIAYPQEGNTIPENLPYRDWCINTFDNGEQIYEAYREIAFDIDYRAEPPKTDYWQTPFETIQSKRGDCEDSVFLFFSKLSELAIDGDIVWGWVVDKGNFISFAHVWYQLFDKHGKLYIVEGFSKEWNGIIPVETIHEAEERVPTLLLRHSQVSYVVDEMIPRFTESFEGEELSWNLYFKNTTIIKEIFQKLQDMFSRYKQQTHELSKGL